jgi:hypothetical protein
MVFFIKVEDLFAASVYKKSADAHYFTASGKALLTVLYILARLEKLDTGMRTKTAKVASVGDALIPLIYVGLLATWNFIVFPLSN